MKDCRIDRAMHLAGPSSNVYQHGQAREAHARLTRHEAGNAIYRPRVQGSMDRCLSPHNVLNFLLIRLIDKSFIIVAEDPRVRQHFPLGQRLCHPNAMSILKEPIKSCVAWICGDDSLARDRSRGVNAQSYLWGVRSFGAQG